MTSSAFAADLVLPDYVPVPTSALGPALKDQDSYGGALAAADIEEFTRSTTFMIMWSKRLDLGAGSRSTPGTPGRGLRHADQQQPSRYPEALRVCQECGHVRAVITRREGLTL